MTQASFVSGFKMKKRVGEIEEFAFGILTGDPVIHTELHITIAVSGWLSDEEPDNFTRPWRPLLNSREQYFLRWVRHTVCSVAFNRNLRDSEFLYFLSITINFNYSKKKNPRVLSGSPGGKAIRYQISF